MASTTIRAEKKRTLITVKVGAVEARLSAAAVTYELVIIVVEHVASHFQAKVPRRASHLTVFNEIFRKGATASTYSPPSIQLCEVVLTVLVLVLQNKFDRWTKDGSLELVDVVLHVVLTGVTFIVEA